MTFKKLWYVVGENIEFLDEAPTLAGAVSKAKGIVSYRGCTAIVLEAVAVFSTDKPRVVEVELVQSKPRAAQKKK